MILYLILTIVNWQQHVSYEMHGNLNTVNHSLKVVEHLTYVNNSPYALETLYLHLPNAPRDGVDRGHMVIEGVIVGEDSLQFSVEKTLMTVPLRRPLMNKDSVTLRIDFSFEIPIHPSSPGYRDGNYEVFHWYPQVCVFNTAGWHLDAYHTLGCTCAEFADYDVTIDLPGDYVVAGTGTQIEPAEKEFLDSLIATGAKLDRGQRKSVRFQAENAQDFAWICDKEFVVKYYQANACSVLIFYRRGNEGSWKNAGPYAVDVISRYNRWFTEYPFAHLNVIDGHSGGGKTYPQVVMLTTGEDPLTRIFEASLARKVGLQWFDVIVGTNRIDEAWFGNGFATYAAMRYMRDKYGEDNSLVKAPLVPPVSLKYFHRLYYYLVQTNQLEKPVSSPISEYDDAPLAYDNSISSKPALFLSNLESIFGKETFDAISHEYFQRYKFRHSKADDYMSICERFSKRELKPLFSSFLNTTDFCDWAVTKVAANEVHIENKGNLMIPVDVYIKTKRNEQVYSIDATKKRDTIAIPQDSGDIIRVAIDPTEHLLDPNYWNNYYPQKIRINPIFNFDWPSFAAYQVIWTPYLWYDTYDGVKAGFYIVGDRFADIDFVRGGNQIIAGNVRGFKSRRNYPSFTYQTPIIFEQDKRVRIRFYGSRSRGGDNLNFGFSSNIGRLFSQSPQLAITNLFTYNALRSYSGLDTIDWQVGSNIVFDNQLKYRVSQLQVDIGLSFAVQAMGGDWTYFKTTFEVKRKFKKIIPFSARLFVGKIYGTASTQERLFLSGALRANFLSSLLFGQSGKYSPQEHVHIPADGNMRGYQTMHIKSDQMVALNLEFPSNMLIRVFTDIGYYDKFVFDVGVRLALGTESLRALPLNGLSISVNLPFYAYIPGEPWKLRWSIGFSS